MGVVYSVCAQLLQIIGQWDRSMSGETNMCESVDQCVCVSESTHTIVVTHWALTHT